METTDKNSNLELLLQYLRYWWKATNEHGVHSPFVFDFVQEVLYDKTPFYSFGELEAYRFELSESKQEIERVDFGAGSRSGLQAKTTIGHIARTQLASPKFAQLLYKMVNYFKPSNVLEFGTSLGLTTMYMAGVSRSRPVFTLEGDPQVAEIAQKGFLKSGLNNIQLLKGEFSESIPKVLTSLNEPLGLVYLDGNHRYDTTLAYLDQLKENFDENTIVVLDDIRWSKGMAKAWKKLYSDDRVTVSIDLFRMGILFFRQGQRKQHFTLRF